MLTLKSRFNNFAKRQGQLVTAADLDVLKKVISEDIVNFRGNVSYGFSAGITEEIVKRITVSKDAKICLLTDTSFHLLLALLEAGFKRENIYIAAGKWTTRKNKAVPSSTDATYMILKRHATASFNEEINIIKLEEMFDLKFDLIIANPPYGKIGAQITDKIRSEVSYEQYINLLPANDYKRVNGLHQYVQDMEPINNGFKDAAVTTHLCNIVKDANGSSVEEFEIAQYIDPQLDKYFTETIAREATFTYSTNTPIAKFKTLDITKTVVLGAKDVNHKHLPYSKSCVQYRWNVAEDVDADWVEAKYSCISGKKEKQTSLFVIYLNSAEEKKALVNLLYSTTGFKFIQKLWRAINIDSYCMPDKYLPKLTYHAGMTWEDVLIDYGYTSEEIIEVLADLENFKDMERDS